MILPNSTQQQADEGPHRPPSSRAAVRNIARNPGNGLLVDAASQRQLIADARRQLESVEQLLAHFDGRRLVLLSWE